MVNVRVKWGKEQYEVDVDTAAPPTAFKEQLYRLTGVPVARQKIMAKGAWKGALKDKEDLSKAKLKEGHQVLMMGTSEGIPEPPKEEVRFLEDLPTEEAAKAGALKPAGLKNLGNTCYMNSTLQALRQIPELRDALNERPSGVPSIDSSLKDMLNELDTSPAAMVPSSFLQVIHNAFPRFAERGGMGVYKQQDSEEFINEILGALARALTAKVPSLTKLVGSGSSEANVIDTLFGLEVKEQMKCIESEDEPVSTTRSTHRKLACNIQGGGGSTVQVNHVHEGVLLGLETEVEKRSELLGRNAQWKKVQRILRLPKYLCLHFVRFYWKETPLSREHAGVKCKISRKVSFPIDNLDVYSWCAPELQQKLNANRGEKPSEKKEEQDVNMTGAAEEDAQSLIARGDAISKQGEEFKIDEVGVGLPDSFKGIYELFAVVTHKGRSADSGHYVAWVREFEDNWLLFDDDQVSHVTSEDIKKLYGGGDWHTAYLTFYRAKAQTY